MEASALHAPAGLHRISVAAPLLRLRSDEQLVALFRPGNDEAFRVIHDRYRQRLFAYARQMLGGSRSDAEDVLQDVFLRAYGALRADERPVSLRAWLYRVAHNRCIDQLRRPVPAPADVFEVSRGRRCTTRSTRPSAARTCGAWSATSARLPEQQRSALLMREMEGLSYAELAEALDDHASRPSSRCSSARGSASSRRSRRATPTAPTSASTSPRPIDRGVRASGRARRHLRDCAGCREYRSAAARRAAPGFAALGRRGPGAARHCAKLLGLGGAGSGAAAGGGGAPPVGGGVALRRRRAPWPRRSPRRRAAPRSSAAARSRSSSGVRPAEPQPRAASRTAPRRRRPGAAPRAPVHARPSRARTAAPGAPATAAARTATPRARRRGAARRRPAARRDSTVRRPGRPAAMLAPDETADGTDRRRHRRDRRRAADDADRRHGSTTSTPATARLAARPPSGTAQRHRSDAQAPRADPAAARRARRPPSAGRARPAPGADDRPPS